jgi:hypothetical protein
MSKRKVSEASTDEAVTILSLNKPARELFDEAASVRVRMDGDAILVLPSTRTKGLGNLPKTDKLIPLSKSDKGIKFSISLPGVATGMAFVIEAMNYGWTRFTKVAEGETIGKDAAVARVVAR